MAPMPGAEAFAFILRWIHFLAGITWIGLLYFFISLITTMILIGWLVLVLMIIWWIIRCVKGLKALFEGVPYANPTTWLW